MPKEWDIVQIRNDFTRFRILIAEFIGNLALSDMFFHNLHGTGRIQIAVQDVTRVYDQRWPQCASTQATRQVDPNFVQEVFSLQFLDECFLKILAIGGKATCSITDMSGEREFLFLGLEFASNRFKIGD